MLATSPFQSPEFVAAYIAVHRPAPTTCPDRCEHVCAGCRISLSEDQLALGADTCLACLDAEMDF